MQDPCLFDIMGLPEETLKRVLPKVSVRMVSRLITAYPRAIGRTLLNVLSHSMSPCTLEFMKDEMASGRQPSIFQIREAEAELIKTLREEHTYQDLIRV